MDFGWAIKGFWIFCVVAILGSAWWAKKMRAEDAGSEPTEKTP